MSITLTTAPDQASPSPIPMAVAPDMGTLFHGHQAREDQLLVAVEPFSDRQMADDTQVGDVVGSTSSSQRANDSHVCVAAGSSSHSARSSAPPIHDSLSGNLFSGYLCLLSDSLDDLEGVRIASENRLRQLTRSAADADGEVRGLGMDERSPEVMAAATLVDGMRQLESDAQKALVKQFRKHPLYPFVKRTSGLGDKQTARLLAAIGDPYWNDLHNRPRTVSELWAYCGYSVIGGAAQKRSKGQKANWSADAKMRTYLVALSCVKAMSSPYRTVYDDARAQYADRTHQTACVRCGPAGKPAQPGSPWNPGHQHQAAVRRMSKQILKDLWVEARAVHGSGSEGPDEA